MEAVCDPQAVWHRDRLALTLRAGLRLRLLAFSEDAGLQGPALGRPGRQVLRRPLG